MKVRSPTLAYKLSDKKAAKYHLVHDQKSQKYARCSITVCGVLFEGAFPTAALRTLEVKQLCQLCAGPLILTDDPLTSVADTATVDP